MKIPILIILLALPAVAGAETESRSATNWVCEDPNFRMVEGQLYDVEASAAFEAYRGHIIAIVPEGAIVDRQVEREYTTWPKQPVSKRPPSNPLSASGGYLGTGPGLSRGPVITTRWESSGEKILIRNFQTRPNFHLGDFETGRAIRSGTSEWKGQAIHAFDYGVPNYSMVITTVITTNSQPAITSATKRHVAEKSVADK